MGIFKHILLISLLLTSIAANSLHAQDEGVIPESDTSPGTFVPQINTGAPTPPVIIDESDSSGVSDNDDYDNN
jgi:hypothetical protein